MNSKFLMTLPLAAVLAVPVWAQQAPSSNTNQNSQTDQTQASTPSDQNAQANPNGHQPLTYERHEGFWGHLNPFARKRYVQRQLDPVRGRLNELDEITSQNAKSIKDVDSRAQEGIRIASAKASEADMHALDAGNRAQLANQTASQATTRLNTVEQVVDNIDQYQPVTETEIRFRPGQAALSAKAKQALDDMVTSVKDQKGYIIEVQGFSPGHGTEAVQSSQQMAQAVVRYLVLNHEVPVYRIYTVGMGNAPMQTAEGNKAHRVRGGRVEISLLKNGVSDLGNQTESAGTPSGGSNAGGMSGAATSSQPNQTMPSQPNQNIGQPVQPQSPSK